MKAPSESKSRRKPNAKKQARKTSTASAKASTKGVSAQVTKSARAGTVTIVAASLTLAVVNALPLERVQAAPSTPAAHVALQMEQPPPATANERARTASNHQTPEHKASEQENRGKGFWRGLGREIFVAVVAGAVVEIVKWALTTLPGVIQGIAFVAACL
ncbi:hypothetical protein GCM10011488_19650 [Steroidobacter agaridevorans]|nr:hypothetical protein GCM10011488_19650 [Steroidobacter agaridevorans]